MRWNPHLVFNGQCEAAFRFYEKCLGGTIAMMMSYGDSPLGEQAPPDWREKILHATFALGDQVLTGGDAPPASYQKPQGFSLLLNVATAEEADCVLEMLAANGEVQMPLTETFWALRFGMLVDQFGTPWMINCGNPA